MQRKVIQILKKWLDRGYDDGQTEIITISPFKVLKAGGVSKWAGCDWTQIAPPPEDRLLRPLARELIATIRGVKDVDLIIVPDHKRTVLFLRGISTCETAKEATAWAETHAAYLIEWLRDLLREQQV